MKNYLGQTLGLTILILGSLAGLTLLPSDLSIGNFALRRMDIFADIRYPGLDTLAVPETDSTWFVSDTSAVLPLPDSLAADSSLTALAPLVDSALYGKIIEDYTPDQLGLNRFWASIDSIAFFKRTVRVAFFGDSFVEGDILLGDLRDTLQTLWGGNGVGFVPITSEVARFKRTLVHRYENWNTFSIVKNHESGQPFGINGFVYRPKPAAFVHYEGADYFLHTRNWTQFRLFYQSAAKVPFVWQNAETQPQIDSFPANAGKLSVWKQEQFQIPFRAFAFRIDQPDSSLLLYGATLESGPGFYLDNFSVRGNTGGRLKLIRAELVQQFDAYQQYDLIIVQLGLNAALPNLNNIRWYRAELDQTFDHLRKCFPNKPILIISVADRAGKVDGNLSTLPSVPAIASMQRDLARHHGFLFYDLYHGMGGPGTMIQFAGQKPALANKDYTHLTHEGGKVMGHIFAGLFLDAQAKYHKTKTSQFSK